MFISATRLLGVLGFKPVHPARPRRLLEGKRQSITVFGNYSMTFTIVMF